jgi:hypothetical protein
VPLSLLDEHKRSGSPDCFYIGLPPKGGEVSPSRVSGMTQPASLGWSLNEKGEQLDVSLRKFGVSRCSTEPSTSKRGLHILDAVFWNLRNFRNREVDSTTRTPLLCPLACKLSGRSTHLTPQGAGVHLVVDDLGIGVLQPVRTPHRRRAYRCGQRLNYPAQPASDPNPVETWTNAQPSGWQLDALGTLRLWRNALNQSAHGYHRHRNHEVEE